MMGLNLSEKLDFGFVYPRLKYDVRLRCNAAAIITSLLPVSRRYSEINSFNSFTGRRKSPRIVAKQIQGKSRTSLKG